MSNKSVFGVPIEGYSIQTIVDRFDKSQAPLWIITANPEILLEAHRDPAYADTLRQATVRTVDGFGLWFLLLLFGHKMTRVTGIDLAERLIQHAHEHGWRAGLIGGWSGTAKKAIQEIKQRYPKLMVEAEEGGMVDRNGVGDTAGEDMRHCLEAFDPQILLVAFGHPKQEFWIAKHKHTFSNLKVVMGVGGSFDVWAGRLKRAPALFRHLGFEWLWRLMQEPRRLRRTWNAVIVFPLCFLKEKFLRAKRV